MFADLYALQGDLSREVKQLIAENAEWNVRLPSLHSTHRCANSPSSSFAYVDPAKVDQDRGVHQEATLSRHLFTHKRESRRTRGLRCSWCDAAYPINTRKSARPTHWNARHVANKVSCFQGCSEHNSAHERHGCWQVGQWPVAGPQPQRPLLVQQRLISTKSELRHLQFSKLDLRLTFLPAGGGRNGQGVYMGST